MKIRIKAVAHDLSEKFSQHPGFSSQLVNMICKIADYEDVTELTPKNVNRKLANHLTALFRDCGVDQKDSPDVVISKLYRRSQKAEYEISVLAAKTLTQYCKAINHLRGTKKGAVGKRGTLLVKLEYVSEVQGIVDAWTLTTSEGGEWSEPVVVSDAYGAINLQSIANKLSEVK